jgi:hypothetical protein
MAARLEEDVVKTLDFFYFLPGAGKRGARLEEDVVKTLDFDGLLQRQVSS